MSRPLSGLSRQQVQIISEIQQGSTYEAASVAAGYKSETPDLKTPAKRAMRKLRKASLNMEIRHAIRQEHPELILMGSDKGTVLKPCTEALLRFAEIDEGFRLFFEARPELLNTPVKDKK